VERNSEVEYIRRCPFIPDRECIIDADEIPLEVVSFVLRLIMLRGSVPHHYLLSLELFLNLFLNLEWLGG